MRGVRWNQRGQLLAWTALAWGLAALPVIHWPLEWLATLCHETGHALAAVLTGGRVDRLEVHFDASGLTWTAGGSQGWVLFMGYAGAIGWGWGLYGAGQQWAPVWARALLRTVWCGLALEALLWTAWQLSSVAITALWLLLLGALAWKPSAGWARPCLRALGAYVLVSSIRAPLDLLSPGVGDNDGAYLAQRFVVPSIVWVGIWWALGLAAWAHLYRCAGRADRQAIAPDAVQPLVSP